MTSITFAAFICDADEPCSVNTAYDPESSFTMSPRSTTLPLYFWKCGSNSYLLFDRDHQRREVHGFAFFPCFIDHLCLVSDFCPLPCSCFLEFFPFLVHCCLCIWNFHCERHRNKFAHQIVVTQWIHAISCNLVFMVLALRPLHAYPHGFVVLSNCATSFSVLMKLKSTKLCCWHRNVQLSTSIFHHTLEFFMIKFNKENTT